MKRSLILALLLVSVLVSADRALASESDTWTVRLEVAYGRAGGPSDFLKALESQTFALAETEACGARITLDPDAPTDAVWRVRVLDLEEETRYDESIYGRHAADREPGRERLLTAEVRFDLESSIEPAAGKTGKAKRLRIRESVRPLGPGERPEEEARARALRRGAGDLARAFCKALRKTRREADRAR